MILDYKKSESTIYPELIDTTSSKKVVYLRKNVVEKQIEDEYTGKSYTMYEYDEAKLTKAEYKQYLTEISVMNLEQMRADVDYISFMTGVDLE